jgi:hypothetical protein
MLNKKRKKETGNATRARVKKEMAKPRMARSARIKEMDLDTRRTSEQPSTTMPGTVKKIICVSSSKSAGKSADCSTRGRPPASRSPYRKYAN